MLTIEQPPWFDDNTGSPYFHNQFVRLLNFVTLCHLNVDFWHVYTISSRGNQGRLDITMATINNIDSGWVNTNRCLSFLFPHQGYYVSSAAMQGLHWRGYTFPGHYLLLPTVLIMSAAVQPDSFHRTYYYNLASNGNHPPELRHIDWVSTRKLPKLASILVDSRKPGVRMTFLPMLPLQTNNYRNCRHCL